MNSLSDDFTLGDPPKAPKAEYDPALVQIDSRWASPPQLNDPDQAVALLVRWAAIIDEIRASLDRVVPVPLYEITWYRHSLTERTALSSVVNPFDRRLRRLDREFCDLTEPDTDQLLYQINPEGYTWQVWWYSRIPIRGSYRMAIIAAAQRPGTRDASPILSATEEDELEHNWPHVRGHSRLEAKYPETLGALTYALSAGDNPAVLLLLGLLPPEFTAIFEEEVAAAAEVEATRVRATRLLRRLARATQ